MVEESVDCGDKEAIELCPRYRCTLALSLGLVCMAKPGGLSLGVRLHVDVLLAGYMRMYVQTLPMPFMGILEGNVTS